MFESVSQTTKNSKNYNPPPQLTTNVLPYVAIYTRPFLVLPWTNHHNHLRNQVRHSTATVHNVVAGQHCIFWWWVRVRFNKNLCSFWALIIRVRCLPCTILLSSWKRKVISLLGGIVRSSFSWRIRVARGGRCETAHSSSSAVVEVVVADIKSEKTPYSMHTTLLAMHK